MSLLTTQGIRVLQVLVASTIILTLFFTVSHFGSGALKDSDIINRAKDASSHFQSSSLNFGGRTPPKPKPANATLDFQEIIYLSMPYRTDRQDALSLIASAAGLKLTMFPGVSGDAIHEKARPPLLGGGDNLYDWEHDGKPKPALGIWRAHANVWKYMIDNDIQSAFIIEDDVDFDVNVKEIMGNFRWQLQYNNTIRWGEDVEKGWDEECAYGCDWDELFVGQCGGKPNPDRLDLHQFYPDPHSPALSDLADWNKKLLTKTWNLTESSNIRVITPTWQPICLMGYALSRMGAMRLLYHIGGWRGFGLPVDNEIAMRTAEGVVSGYTLNPPAFTSWRVGGSQDSDNDAGMLAQKVNTKGNMDGKSQNLKSSIRTSLAKFFEKSYWKDMEEEVRNVD
ncbi:hypothetical protein BDV96DRAFT_486075 [Lophiotrema nucula]|uniref:Glycosyl transferase family 25 domain-containing protein n=1 Tax=Lophiotrema nucula TaxID=690887 RepID=A0A6A5ZLY9_9PLEO|nr:hypothetical protein BDV96DRAFT_486075 [Lophiotrema nucula]